jgi:site-specific DNA recombinase
MAKQNNSQLTPVVYTRVSSDEQVRGYGLKYQLDECQKLMRQHGHRLARVYSDPGISGTIEDRPGLSELRRDAKAGKFSMIYIYKSDRLARDEILQLRLFREFQDEGIEVYSATEPHMNDLMRGIYAVFGAEELRTIKRRMYSGRMKAMREGKWIAPIPLGYAQDLISLRLRIDSQQAQWVRRMFEWFVGDRLSLTALAQRLYVQKVPTQYGIRKRRKPRNGPYFWSKGMVARVLSREYYATGQAWFCKYKNPDLKRLGREQLRPEEDWIMVPVPPIVPTSLYQAAQKQIVRNREMSPRRAWRTYLFAKKLVCGVCNCKLTALSNGEKKYYRGGYWSEARCLSCPYYTERDLEEPVWKALQGLLRQPEVFMADLDAYRNRDLKLSQLSEEEQELAVTDMDIEKKERSLLEYELAGRYSKLVLEEKHAELSELRDYVSKRRLELAKLRLMQESKAATVASAKALWERTESVWKDPTYEEKREIFLEFIDKIVLTGHTEGANNGVLVAGSGQGGSTGASIRGNPAASRDRLRLESDMKRDANSGANFIKAPGDIGCPVVFTVDLCPVVARWAAA